jgi:hypothetical protein
MQTAKRKTAATDALVGLWAVALTSFDHRHALFCARFLNPTRPCRTAHLSPVAVGDQNRALAGADRRSAPRGGDDLRGYGGGLVITQQLVDLATKLPDYKENIQTKLRSIKLPTGGVFTKFSETVEELRKDLPGAETSTSASAKPRTPFFRAR